MSEPAILVKRRNKGSQIWSMDKFENKIFDMREMYEERKEKGLPMMVEEETITPPQPVCAHVCLLGYPHQDTPT